METNQNREVVEKFFALSNSGDSEGCFKLFSDDVVWTDIGTSRFAGTYSGKQSVLNDLIIPLFSQLKAGIQMRLENVISEGDQVVVQANGFAETLDGVPYNNSYCQVFRLRDGRICSVVEYCDTALINQVFGDER